MSATEAIDNISAGLTGTGLLALGVFLAAQGLIRGHGEDEGEEKEFLTALCEGLLCLKKASEKFALKAKTLTETAPDEEAKNNMLKIYEAANRTPWEKPQSFYEALNCLAFCRKVMGALEGIGFNSFGRVDMDLYPFFKKDIENGVLTDSEIEELIGV